MSRTMLIAAAILASQLTSSSQETKPLQAQSKEKEAPRLLSPVYEDRAGGVIASGPGGLALGLQFFGFNPATRESGPHRHSYYSQQLYGNTIIDAERLSKIKRLGIGELVLTTTEQTCAFISISFESHRKVAISPDYLVSPAEATQAKSVSGQPFVLVYFDLRSAGASGGKAVSGTLVVRRNADKPSRFPLTVPDAISKLDFYQLDAVPIADTGFPVMEVPNAQRKGDVIEWNVEVDGKVTHGGTVSFPVLGTVPNLVVYRVPIMKLPKK